MKYAIDGEHRNYFQNHHRIEFDNLLSPEQLEACNSAINEVLSVRLGTNQASLKKLSPETLFMAGHDLWRAHPVIKKIVSQRSFGEVAGELVMEQVLRLGYDQLIIPPAQALPGTEENPVYHEVMKNGANLESLSGIQGVVGGLMLCLEDAPNETNLEEHPDSAFFPTKAGNGVFFDASVTIPFNTLVQRERQRFLMIVFIRQVAVYIMQKGDPHLHHLKRFGYQFGDKLSIKHHPVIFR